MPRAPVPDDNIVWGSNDFCRVHAEPAALPRTGGGARAPRGDGEVETVLFEPGGTPRGAALTWWLGVVMFVQPWRLSVHALAGLWRRPDPGRRGVPLPTLSDQWLRQYEAEAAKRQSDP